MVLVGVVGDIIIRAVEIVSLFLGGADGTAGVADCTASRGACASLDVERGGEGTGDEEGGHGQDLRFVLMADGLMLSV